MGGAVLASGQPLVQPIPPMTKVAVAIVHGIGDTTADFANEMMAELKQRFAKATPGVNPDDALALEPVYWGPILQEPENELWARLKKGGDMDFTTLRRFMVSFAADALAYQPLPEERSAYDAIHATFASTLKVLALKAGGTAPLVVVSHSLGTVVSSNFFYDLSKPAMLPESVTDVHGEEPTALERGKTFTAFYTLGSPIALWSLRFREFGKPITVPASGVPAAIAKAGGWYNFYDPDDVIGYPLRSLNPAYRAAVKKDVALNAGGIFTSWSPLSHTEYWTDNDVTEPLADTLVKIWRAANA